MAAAAVRAAEELAEREMAGRDASHDAAHALRVRDLALSLAAELGLSSSPDRLLIVEIAALLHDIGDYKYTKDNAEDMSIVERFLEEVELEQGQREEIVAIIKGMGFKNEVSKKSVVEPTLEFAIVQDADRLDAIGAIGKYCITEVSLSALLKQSFLQQLGCSKCCTGIARCFTYGGSKKNTLHDPKILPRDNLSKEKYMSKDEKQTSINHFHEKLFKLKDMMKTEAGKKRAEKRHKFMEDFVAEFYEEWSGRA
uniref:HD domain protein n=1 Tax=Oryza sativa subsp. japonica TaxID=39947 RepID=Q8W371_ORYSJ|nr:putative HD domain protein [Oryza sativa Japonica Group]